MKRDHQNEAGGPKATSQPISILRAGECDRLPIFPASSHHGPVESRVGWLVLRVALSSIEHRTEIERFLSDGGYAVIGRDELPFEAQMGTVSAMVELTNRQREAVEALMDCDHTSEMARRLFITEKALDDLVQRLESKLDVRSRHRLVVRLAEYGLIRIQPRSRWPG